jgi:hypothetical protein
MEQPWRAEGLNPTEQAVYLVKLRSSMRAAYEVLGDNLQAALADAVGSDLAGVAKALGVTPAMAVRMATDPHMPDVALMRRGLMILRHRPGLPVDVIIKAREATRIDGASDEDIHRIAELLTEVASTVPDEVWAGASASDRVTFNQSVSVATKVPMPGSV